MKHVFYSHREECRLCGSVDLECVVPLEPIPVLSPNLGTHQELEQVKVPVDLYRCRECGAIQLLDQILPEIQYGDFRYRTAISLGLPHHFEQLAATLLERYGERSERFVLEIGSNDGTLLRAFQQYPGCRVLGVDPSQPVSAVARERGVPTLTGFFDSGLADEIVQQHGRADFVVCNNTFANIDALDDFIAGVRAVLSATGVFVIETAHGLSVINNVQIDTVYHEHLSYFLVSSLDLWFTTMQMELVEVESLETKGGSIRLVVQHQGGPLLRSGSVERVVAAERAAGLFDRAPYLRFSEVVAAARRDLVAEIGQVVKHGGTVAGYGASVGTMTLLYQLGVADTIQFIVDDAPLAEALMLPDRQIPIFDREKLLDSPPALVVIFAFRYADPIIEANRQYLRQGGRFIVPIPTVRVMDGN